VSGARASLLPCAGLVFGPAAWAGNMQASLFLPLIECRAGLALSLPLTAACILVAMIGGAISFRQWWAVGRDPARDRSAYPHSFEFVCATGALVGTIVAFALLLQAIASLAVSPCLR
jgi:hypothetical protein